MSNVYIYGPLTLWFVAQLAKFSINLVRGRADIRYLVASGGMPSAHAAVVCSLATIAMLDSGVNSPIFGLAAVLAAIVMYDSFGVRRSSGEQAHLINRMINDLQGSGALRSANDYKGLREILGHKPFEVLIGALLGILGGLAFEWQKADEQLKWLTDQITHSQIVASWIVLGVGLALGVAISIVLRKKYGVNKANRRSIASLLRWHVAAVVALALLMFSAYQRVSILDQAWLVIIEWLIIGGGLIALYIVRLPKITRDGRVDEQKLRRDKWLKKSKKKK